MAKKLGERLVQAGTIDSKQLLLALIEQKKIDRPLGTTLVQMGVIDEATLIKALADHLSLPLVRLRGKRIDTELLDLVPSDLAEKHHCLPLLLKSEADAPALYVAMEDPGDADAIRELGRVCKMKIRPVLAAPSELQDALARHYAWAPPSDGAVFDPSSSDSDLDLDVEGELDPLADIETMELDDFADSLEPEADLDLSWTALDAEAEAAPAVAETGPGACGASSDAVLRALTQILVEKEIITREELVERLTMIEAESIE